MTKTKDEYLEQILDILNDASENLSLEEYQDLCYEIGSQATDRADAVATDLEN